MHVDDTNGVPTPHPPERTTTRYMTKYEKARVLGTRALQIRLDLISLITEFSHGCKLRREIIFIITFLILLVKLHAFFFCGF
jgi:hypothetical protein